MAEENDTVSTSEDVTTEAAVATADAKKQRAPRRSKEVLAALAAQKAASKKPRKAFSKAASAELTRARPTGTSKASSAKMPADTSDEIVDLAQLEEENKSLRKALAEKLQAENLDLRKRLGQD